MAWIMALSWAGAVSAASGTISSVTEWGVDAGGKQAKSLPAKDDFSDDEVPAVPCLSLNQENRLRALVKRYEKDKSAWLHFSKPSCMLVKNRSLRLVLNRKKLKVSYTSSNNKIVTVSGSGIIYTRKPGLAVITAKYKKHSCHMVVCVLPKETGFYGKVQNRLVSANEAVEAAVKKRKTVLIAGSSAVDRWISAQSAFPSYNVINNAIGGTTTSQWLVLYKQLIVPYKPDAVVLFVGSNDIGDSGRISGKRSAERITLLIRKLRASLGKDVPIFYVSMLINWRRQRAWKEERNSNAAVKKFCGKTQNVYYIDVASSFLNGSGYPIRSLFDTDLLHPNSQGYKIFRQIIGKKVRKVLK